jgi:hypothetical protein
MKRFLLVSGIILCGVAGAVVGVFSLDAQAWLYGPRYSSARYSGVGGGMRGLIEGAFAMCAGAVVAGRGAWLVASLINRVTGGKPMSGERVARTDAPIIGVLLLWVYVIWASW